MDKEQEDLDYDIRNRLSLPLETGIQGNLIRRQKKNFFLHLLIRVAYRYIQFLSFSRLYCAFPPILSILDVNGLADQHS